jgi:signal transduction histidine kinase
MSNRYSWLPGHETSSSQAADASASRQQMAGHLAGTVAHDLNNLFATILGCLELMERRVEDPDRLRVLIKRSSDAVERAASLTSRLAQFAQRQEQPKTLADINTLIADLMPLIASALGRRIRVSAETSSTPAPAHVDLAGLEATLLALCMAARAALPEMGHITLATQVSELGVAVSVAVIGPGLNQLDVTHAHRIASTAGLAVQTALAVERAEITVLLSPIGHSIDAD